MASRTCIHCVLFRAVTYSVRRRPTARIAFSGAGEPCWVPGGPEATYRRIRSFLRDSVPDEAAPTRLRLLAGARPEIQLMAVSATVSGPTVRTLRLARYADEILAHGFAEAIVPGIASSAT